MAHGPAAPKMSVTDDDVKPSICDDRRVSIRQIVSFIGVSFGSVQWALIDTLGMGKLSARWVARMLMPDQKLAIVGTYFKNTVDSFPGWSNIFLQSSLPWIRPGFTSLNSNPRYKASNGNTLILHLPRSSNRLPRPRRSFSYLFSRTVKVVLMIDYLQKGHRWGLRLRTSPIEGRHQG